MDALQWHAHTFDSSSLDDSDWDSDTTNDSYQSDLDFRSHLHRSPSIDSTDSSGPAQYWLDAFLELAVAPEDLPDAYELAMTPEDFISSDPESESSKTEYDDEELLILNSPDALYQLFLKDKLQVQISASKQWELLCPDCAEWCQTGIHSGINLWISGQTPPMEVTMTSAPIPPYAPSWKDLPTQRRLIETPRTAWMPLDDLDQPGLHLDGPRWSSTRIMEKLCFMVRREAACRSMRS
ncbi:uncharacterized protein HD556DRAFT_1441037 [Suillus plorans]|uniref:Uncharacterized protein n=1 Tax=Suillus plorans TaxID=116603 RepID=A0A9P7IY56_9AGAM|nr:uncharacterized protein HD556DRAFT_1441037 [Suillus plorans]KAG1797478.1 hypothetical protein HD556DRAFT_1441037 [Suillus plorans]